MKIVIEKVVKGVRLTVQKSPNEKPIEINIPADQVDTLAKMVAVANNATVFRFEVDV